MKSPHLLALYHMSNKWGAVQKRRLLLFSKAANGFGEKNLRSDPRVPAGKAGEDTLSARRVFFPTYMPPEKMI